jgi:sRNA-binding carbon storage regulator CsrA
MVPIVCNLPPRLHGSASAPADLSVLSRSEHRPPLRVGSPQPCTRFGRPLRASVIYFAIGTITGIHCAFSIRAKKNALNLGFPSNNEVQVHRECLKEHVKTNQTLAALNVTDMHMFLNRSESTINFGFNEVTIY